jgi:hypothetical protein
MLTPEQIAAIVRESAKGSATRRDGSTSYRIARAIESAATAPLLARIAELEAQLVEARKDAERYRWLRAQHWNDNLIGVVIRPKDQTKLGSFLPCESLLDYAIDHMRNGGAAIQAKEAP